MPLTSDIPLPLAVWLMHNEYDYVLDNPNYYSATELLKPTRSLVLGRQLPEPNEVDIAALIAPKFGTAIHDSIEKAWKSDNLADTLKKLNIPKSVKLDVHIEERAFKNVDEFTVGGKFDMVLNGVLHDFKTTSVYAYLTDSKDEDYKLQGSIYRWLNPDLITEDFININFIFTDWNKKESLIKSDYPKNKVASKCIQLMSIPQTDTWVRRKLKEIKENMHSISNQDRIIECTEKELWMTPPVFKYYASGDTSGRSTKNFSDANDAYKYKASKGSKGTIVMVPGEPKRCNYCPAINICLQYRRMTGHD